LAVDLVKNWVGVVLLYPDCRKGMVPPTASLMIGLAWTFWHLPGHFVSSYPLVNVVAQLLYTVPLSFVFAWLYYRSGESLLPVVLMHGALNGFNVFFERTLFPPLTDEDSFVIFFILVALVLGIISAVSIRRQEIGPRIAMQSILFGVLWGNIPHNTPY